MKKLSIYLILSVAPLLFFSACGEKATASKTTSPEVIPVKTMAVAGKQGSGTISLSGQFTTDDEVMLSFKTGGVISKIFVKEGDAIRQGQLLATLDLTEINAQVQQAQLGYEKAQRDHQRVNNLYRDSVATLEQLQNSRTALDIARQQLNTARFNQGYSEIHAPKNGFVLRKLASEGQIAGPGTPVIQTNGAASGNWLLKAGASDAEWNAAGTGDKAIITANGKTYEGTVVRKSKSIDPVTGTFMIEIRIDTKDTHELASGMFGQVKITGKSAVIAQAGQWYVPYDALLDGDGTNGYVFATNDGKTAHKVKVTIGGMENNEVLITDGLQEVQQVIISGSAYLADQSPIRIIQ